MRTMSSPWRIWGTVPSCLLIPQVSKAARIGDRVAIVMAEEAVSVEEMLEALDEERAK